MDSLNNPDMVAKEVDSYLYQMELEDEGLIDLEDAYASPILDAKYDKVEIEEVIRDNCSHLDPVKQRQLRDVLLKHETLFDGVLKKYPGQPMHIDLVPGATPVYRRPYPVPQVHLATFKKELNHLIDIRVLSPINYTEWACQLLYRQRKMAQ